MVTTVKTGLSGEGEPKGQKEPLPNGTIGYVKSYFVGPNYNPNGEHAFDNDSRRVAVPPSEKYHVRTFDASFVGHPYNFVKGQEDKPIPPLPESEPTQLNNFLRRHKEGS